MKRRTFISLIPLVPLSVLLGCGTSDKRTSEDVLSAILDKIIKSYNQGEFETTITFVDSCFSFIDGGVSGNFHGFKKRIRMLHRYHGRRGLLPLSISNRRSTVVGNIGWTVCDVDTGSQDDKYGMLTLIFRQYESDWKLVHQHFSLAPQL